MDDDNDNDGGGRKGGTDGAGDRGRAAGDAGFDSLLGAVMRLGGEPSADPLPTAAERLREEIHDRVHAARRDGRKVSAVVLDAERYGWLVVDEARWVSNDGTGGVPDPGVTYGYEIKAVGTDDKTLWLLFEDDSRTMSEYYTDDERREEQDDG